jgi:hypothetical protein
MKFAPAYKGVLAFSLALQAVAECIPGHHETIRSGYTVEYKCDLYRTGEARDNISSENACAVLCADSNPVRSICSYHQLSKRCILGSPEGRDIAYPNVTYMVKIDNTGDKDPFTEDCTTEKDDCLKRETAWKLELAKCQAGPSEPLCMCSSPSSLPQILMPLGPQHNKKLYTTPSGKRYIIYCDFAMWNHYVTGGVTHAPGTNLTDCIQQCSRISDCGNVNFNKKDYCEFKTFAPPADLAADRRVTGDWNMAVLVY